MARVRILLVLLTVGGLVAGAGALQVADRGTAARTLDTHRMVPPAQAALNQAAPPARSQAVARRARATVPTLVSPRGAAGLHMTFPRTWRPVTLEVGSPVQRPPLRVLCASCPPGTVVDVDL